MLEEADIINMYATGRVGVRQEIATAPFPSEGAPSIETTLKPLRHRRLTLLRGGRPGAKEDAA
jgi:hypothetical protein